MHRQRSHASELADAHHNNNTLTHSHKGAGSTGGHPSYGKHSWTINLISIMVTHEWNAVPCFMMANWCWYTPNVALINIGRNRELTQNWCLSLLMKKSKCSLLRLLASDGGLFTDGEQGEATREANGAAKKINRGVRAARFYGFRFCTWTEVTWHSFYASNKLVKLASHTNTQNDLQYKTLKPVEILCCICSLLGPTLAQQNEST